MRQLAYGDEAMEEESNFEDDAIEEQQVLPPVVPRVKIARSKTLEKDVQKRLFHGHHVEYTEERGTCKVRCNPGRRKPRIQSKCVECDVFLCCTGKYQENCFRRFHNNATFSLDQDAVPNE
jgi:hypothetical protein